MKDPDFLLSDGGSSLDSDNPYANDSLLDGTMPSHLISSA